MTKDVKAKVVTAVVIAVVVIAVAVKRTGWKPSDGISTPPILSSEPDKQAEPRDTIYAMLDAARDGDVEAYIACYTGEMARQLEQSTAEMTRDGFAKYLQDRNREIKGIAINEPEQASSDRVRVRVEYVYQDRNEAQFFYLEKDGSDWMITGADATQRVPTLVPYGTPVY